MLKNTYTTIVRASGEWAECFVTEREPQPRSDGSLRYSATFCALSSLGVYGYFWYDMGEPFGEFIRDLSAGYLLGKIATKVFDEKLMLANLKREICINRRQQGCTKAEARAALDALDSLAQQYDGPALATMIYEDSDVSQVIHDWDITTQDYEPVARRFVAELWPAFVAEFTRERAKELMNQ